MTTPETACWRNWNPRVNTCWLPAAIAGHVVAASAIMVDAKGERMVVNYPSPIYYPDADWLNDIDFSQWDVVLADVRWHDGAKQAFTLARQAGVRLP